MLLRVTEVRPRGDHTLDLRFSDGSSREVDVSFLFHGPLGEPLRDPAYFRQVTLDTDAGTVVWPNGLDPDPMLLHRDGANPGPPTSAQDTKEKVIGHAH